MCLAFADESMRSTNQSIYMIGATIFHDDAEASLSELVSQKPRNARKLHWRELGRKAQAGVLQTVAEAPATTTVIIAAPMNLHRQERARRKCLEALRPLLEAESVETLVIESRNDAADRRDIDMVSVLRSQKRIDIIRIEHRKGASEPRLWFPDIVLGAYGDVLCGDELPGDWMDAWHRAEEKTVLETVDL